jgi:hypothetical protein
MKDRNICPYCEAPVPVEQVKCLHCRQRLALDSKGKISIWQLGKVRAELLASMAVGLRNAFLVDVVIQPGFLDPRPSERPQWRGLSATVFLNQVYRRHKKGNFVSIAVPHKKGHREGRDRGSRVESMPHKRGHRERWSHD